MSEVFEGVLCAPESDRVAEMLVTWNADPSLRAIELPDSLVAIFGAKSRRDVGRGDGGESLAMRVSRDCRRALLVRYDSRAGYRYAALFEGGEGVSEFGPDDELYVPLDENGEPLAGAPRIRVHELSPEEEYETVENAIQLGLRKLGRGRWEDLKALIAKV